MDEFADEAPANLELVRAEIEEGLESAKRLVEEAKFLLSGDAGVAAAEQA